MCVPGRRSPRPACLPAAACNLRSLQAGAARPARSSSLETRPLEAVRGTWARERTQRASATAAAEARVAQRRRRAGPAPPRTTRVHSRPGRVAQHRALGPPMAADELERVVSCGRGPVDKLKPIIAYGAAHIWRRPAASVGSWLSGMGSEAARLAGSLGRFVSSAIERRSGRATSRRDAELAPTASAATSRSAPGQKGDHDERRSARLRKWPPMAPGCPAGRIQGRCGRTARPWPVWERKNICAASRARQAVKVGAAASPVWLAKARL